MEFGIKNTTPLTLVPPQKLNYLSINLTKYVQDLDKENYKTLMKEIKKGASLVAQWLRIRLPMQGTWVQALAQEDNTCCGTTKPACHNY